MKGSSEQNQLIYVPYNGRFLVQFGKRSDECKEGREAREAHGRKQQEAMEKIGADVFNRAFDKIDKGT